MKEPPIMHIGANYGISLFHRAAPDLEAKRQVPRSSINAFVQKTRT